MTRSARTMVRLGSALALSLVAGVILFQWMVSRRVPAPALTKVETARMAVVAARDLTRGTRLAPDMLKLTSFPAESLPLQSFSQASEIDGRVLLAPVFKDEAVTGGKLAPEGAKGGGVSALIGPGKRAMAVKGNKVMGLSGFIRPGNMVDVLVSLDGEGEQKSVAKLVLANVPVLATGNELEYDPKSDKPSSVEIYTLEVTPEESEVLALASTKGTLHFALRGSDDSGPALTQGVDVSQALASNRPAQAKRAARTGPARESTMQVITGSKLGTVNF